MADNLSPEIFGVTPSQTVGPFFHYGLPWKGGADLVGQSDLGARPDLFPPEHYVLRPSAPRAHVPGTVIEIAGRVLDGDGAPVPDALIEIWQADPAGRHDNPDWVGFGRGCTDAEGVYRFRTLRPGVVPGPGNALQAPHVAIGVLGRGLLKRLATRLYFSDAPENADDPILALVPEERRGSLIATLVEGVWRFDIVLQGDRETVFFDF